MNDQKIALLIDSGCDIAKDYVEKFSMKVLPLKIMYKEKEYKDSIEIDPLMIYERFPGEVPTTSTPTPQDVIDMVKEIKDDGYEKVIVICISSGLSSTYNMIASTLEDEDIQSFVLDTKNISIGSGNFAILAGMLIEQGLTFEEIVNKLNDKIHDSKVHFYMDTLEYLKKGGRIGKVTAIIGDLLNIKPVISCNSDGVYYTVTKIRGSRGAHEKLISETKKFINGKKALISILNGGAKEEALKLKEEVQKAIENCEIIISDYQITASLAVHTGPGLLGIGTLLI